MNNKEQQTITIPLHDLIFCSLGDDLNGLACAEVTPIVGVVLDNLLKNSLKWKIEFNDWDGEPLQRPVLWRFQDWKTESSRIERLRLYAEKEQIVSGIRQENLRRIKRVLMDKHHLMENYAEMLAYKLLKGEAKEAIKFFGVEHLADKEEDIKYERPHKFWRNYLK
jgi:hypothetical protein